MQIDKILASIGLARIPRTPVQVRPLWEENGYRVVVSSRTYKNGNRTVRSLALEHLEDFVWREVKNAEYLRHPCFSYDSKRQALRKLQAEARQLWLEQSKSAHQRGLLPARGVLC